jgi:methionyl aminopeptidase
MTFPIEPMITAGDHQVAMWPDGWTAMTADRSRCAQFEHSLLVTDDGAEILTVPSEKAGHPYRATSAGAHAGKLSSGVQA